MFIYCDLGLSRIEAGKLELRLSNAIKFTSPGGKLNIEAGRKNSWCQISVVDNGVGIKQEDRERIFKSCPIR